jgi:hypothetical protein
LQHPSLRLRQCIYFSINPIWLPAVRFICLAHSWQPCRAQSLHPSHSVHAMVHLLQPDSSEVQTGLLL